MCTIPKREGMDASETTMGIFGLLLFDCFGSNRSSRLWVRRDNGSSLTFILGKIFATKLTYVLTINISIFTRL